MHVQESSRLEAPGAEGDVVLSISQHLLYLDGAIRDLRLRIKRLFDDHRDLRGKRYLLTSIPGVGKRTVEVLIGEFDMSQFSNSKQVAAFAGLSPQHYQSGKISGRSRISKTGSSRLRKALFFPAIVAMTCNPNLKRFSRRLTESGKPKLLIIAAVMRKLRVLAYAVSRSGRPYDPSFVRAA